MATQTQYSNRDARQQQYVVEHPYMALYAPVLLASTPVPAIWEIPEALPAPTVSVSAPIVEQHWSSWIATATATATSRNEHTKNDDTGTGTGTGAPPPPPSSSSSPPSPPSSSPSLPQISEKNDARSRGRATVTVTEVANATPQNKGTGTNDFAGTNTDVLTLLNRDDFNLDGLDDQKYTPSCCSTKSNSNCNSNTTAIAANTPVVVVSGAQQQQQPPITDENNGEWLDMFEALLKYKSTHGGSTAVPRHYRTKRGLGIWIRKQKWLFERNQLSPPQKSLIQQNVYFQSKEWKNVTLKEEHEFKIMYARLLDRKKTTGSIHFPHYNGLISKQTNLWMNQMRQRQNWMEEHQKKLLDNLGFDWETHNQKQDRKWMRMYDAFRQYKKNHGGSTVVPLRWLCHSNDGSGGTIKAKLGRWLHYQRRLHTAGRLPRDRKELLDKLHLDWDGFQDRSWMSMFSRLTRCKQLEKTKLIPYEDEVENRDLRNWCLDQKFRADNGILDEEYRKLLNIINFDWTEGK